MRAYPAPTTGDKILRAYLCKCPLAAGAEGGRNKEGLGDFIRRWEGREETPPPEQYMELKLPEGLGWLALFIAHAHIHTYIYIYTHTYMVLYVFFSRRLYWPFSGKDPGHPFPVQQLGDNSAAWEAGKSPAIDSWDQ